MTATDRTREELLAALSQLGRLRPEWRVGQTLANLATTAGRLDAGGVWELEDAEALRAARALIAECQPVPPDAEPGAAPDTASKPAVLVS